MRSYSLQMGGYFQAEPSQEEFHGAELIDMSGSGLLFCYSLDEIKSNFLLYDDLHFTMKIGDDEFPVHGRIMRKFNDQNRGFLGVRFSDLAKEGFTLLLSKLYGEDYSEETESRREEGNAYPGLP